MRRIFTIAGLVLATTPVRADVQVAIDNTKPHQTMQGFGATTISLVFNALDNVPTASRTLAIDALFNQVKLNMGNLEVEPFESPATNLYAPANDDGNPAAFSMDPRSRSGASRSRWRGADVGIRPDDFHPR